MPLERAWFSLSGEVGTKAVLVLDASTSAKKAWNRIVDTALAVLQQLPGQTQPEVYFLGNGNPYRGEVLSYYASQWAQENRNRVSLIAPVFRALEAQPAARIAVLASGEIFDLNDWEEHHLVNKTIWCSFGESILPAGSSLKELANPSVQQLLDHLDDPLVSVRITGRGFMPVNWTSVHYRFSFQQGVGRLEAENAPDFAIQLEALSLRNNAPEAFLKFASGTTWTVSLSSCEAAEGSAAQPLSSEEKELFDKGIRKQNFTCLWCRAEHSWNTLRCLAKDELLGRPVYPSLAEAPPNSFALFYVERNHAYVRVHPVPVLYLGGSRVAIQETGRARLYEYQSRSGQWLPTRETLAPYQRLEDGAYAIFL